MNSNIVQSEIEGGVYLKDLPDETTLEIETQNRSYTLVNRGQGQALISGHPEFCPEPIAGTRSMLQVLPEMTCRGLRAQRSDRLPFGKMINRVKP